MIKYFSLVLLVFCLSCSSHIPEISLTYKETAKGLGHQAEPEDLNTIFGAGPLYTLSADVDQPALRAYRQLRKSRVAEMIEMMKSESELFKQTTEELPQYREIILQTLGEISINLDLQDSDQAQLDVYVRDTIQRLTDTVTKTTARQINIQALKATLDQMQDENSAATALFWYAYYYQTHLFIKEIGDELAYFSGRLAGLISIIEQNENKFRSDGFVERVRKYEKHLGESLIQIQKPFQKVISIHLDLAYGFRLLQASDYAFTMASLEFVSDVANELKKTVERTPVRGTVTTEDKAYYDSYAVFLKTYSSVTLNQFKNVQVPRELDLLPVKNAMIPGFGIGVAHAGVSDWLGQAASGLTEKIKGAGQYTFGAVSSCVTGPLACAKDNFKTAQKTVGGAVDSINFAVGASMDVGMNLYYGNTMSDLKDITGKNMINMFKSWDEGKMGSTVLKTARDYLEGTEKTMGKMTEGMVQNVFGEGYMSWGAGKLAEITTNMATGFGKGVTALANTQSTSEELVEGALDVAFSFTGGSKSVVKGSQVVDGVSEVAEQLAKKGAQQLEKVSVKMQTESLRNSTNTILKTAATKLNEAELQIIYSNTRQIVANEAKEKILKETEVKVTQLLADTLENSSKAVWGNMKEVPSNISTFVAKKFESSLSGFKEASKEVFGGTLKDWGNNVFANIVDDQIKTYAKSFVSNDEAAKVNVLQDKMGVVPGLPLDLPQVQQVLKEVASTIQASQEAIQAVDQTAEKVAQDAVKSEIQKTVVQTAIDKAKEELSKQVSASGSFRGDYSGSVSLQFKPIGGPVSGTVTTKYGSAGISGSVTENGSLKAGVSGSMRYVDENGNQQVCSLSAQMNGVVAKGRASGQYSGKCAKEGDSGSWSVTW